MPIPITVDGLWMIKGFLWVYLVYDLKFCICIKNISAIDGNILCVLGGSGVVNRIDRCSN